MAIVEEYPSDDVDHVDCYQNMVHRPVLAQLASIEVPLDSNDPNAGHAQNHCEYLVADIGCSEGLE